MILINKERKKSYFPLYIAEIQKKKKNLKIK